MIQSYRNECFENLSLNLTTLHFKKKMKKFTLFTPPAFEKIVFTLLSGAYMGGAVVLSPLPWDLSVKVKIRVWWVKNDLELIFKGVFSPLEMLLIIAICIIQVFGMSSRNPYEDQGEITSGDD